MSAARHTPGPWVAVPSTQGPEIAIRADGWGIALCADGLGDGVMECNARLIAAAPALKEALEVVLASYPGSMLHPRIKAQAYAALAMTEPEAA